MAAEIANRHLICETQEFLSCMEHCAEPLGEIDDFKSYQDIFKISQETAQYHHMPRPCVFFVFWTETYGNIEKSRFVAEKVLAEYPKYSDLEESLKNRFCKIEVYVI